MKSYQIMMREDSILVKHKEEDLIPILIHNNQCSLLVFSVMVVYPFHAIKCIISHLL